MRSSVYMMLFRIEQSHMPESRSDSDDEVRAISGRVASFHSTESFEEPSDKGQTLHPPGV